MTEVKSEPGVEEVPVWGRLLIAGGTDFATLGRKDKGGKTAVNAARPELPSMHIMRTVANIKFKRVITSHSGCHVVALDIDDQAWVFGRNEHHQLSYPLPSKLTSSHNGPDGKPSPTPAAPFPFLLNNLADNLVPKSLKEQKIVEAAVGRGHTILITENGEAWSCGWNNLGQCGHPNNKEHVSSFTRVGGLLLSEKVVSASCGVNFSLFLTSAGKVYSVGSGQNGQLGNGKTGEYIATSKVFFTEQTTPLLVNGAIENKKIIQISSGQQHSLALDDQGIAYAWGFGGLGRLGSGVQVDQLVPGVIPHFSGANLLTRCRKLTAGSTNSLFICAQGMVSLCGKWKSSGDGSSGQPTMSPKLVQDIMGYKWEQISSGGVTLFASTFDNKEGEFLVGWGQGASSGELGLGEGSVRSATKPTRIEGMDGISLIDLSAGQNSTFFIARPPPTPTELIEQKRIDDEIEASKVKEDTSSLVVSSLPSTSSGIDLSGFGFSFGPPPPSTTTTAASTSKPSTSTIPAVTTGNGNKKKGISKTLDSAWEELGRYPLEVKAADLCLICKSEKESEDGLECEMCENAFHGSCLTPPIIGIPEGEWFCPSCESSNRLLPNGLEVGETDADYVDSEQQEEGSKKRKSVPMEKKGSNTSSAKGKKKKV